MKGKSNNLGGLVKEFRKRSKISQSGLARLAGIHPSHLNRIESGDRPNPRRKTVEALAHSLLLSPRETGQLMFSAGYISHNPKLTAGTFGAPPVEVLEESDMATNINNGKKPEDIARYILFLLSADDIPRPEKAILARQIRSFAEWSVSESRQRCRSRTKKHARKDHRKKS